MNLKNGLGPQNIDTIPIGLWEDVLSAHKVILFYGWGIGVDIAIIVVRYMKTIKYYLFFHTTYFFILDAVTIILEGLIFYVNRSKLNIKSLTTEDSNHFIIGIAVFIVLLI